MYYSAFLRSPSGVWDNFKKGTQGVLNVVVAAIKRVVVLVVVVVVVLVVVVVD